MMIENVVGHSRTAIIPLIQIKIEKKNSEIIDTSLKLKIAEREVA